MSVSCNIVQYCNFYSIELLTQQRSTCYNAKKSVMVKGVFKTLTFFTSLVRNVTYTYGHYSVNKIQENTCIRDYHSVLYFRIYILDQASHAK